MKTRLATDASVLNRAIRTDARLVEGSVRSNAHAQAHKIDIRGHARITAVLRADNPGHMRTMKARRPVVIRIRIVFSEIPAADDLVRAAKAAAQRRLIVGDAAIDDRHRLPVAIKAVLIARGGQIAPAMPLDAAQRLHHATQRMNQRR